MVTKTLKTGAYVLTALSALTGLVEPAYTQHNKATPRHVYTSGAPTGSRTTAMPRGGAAMPVRPVAPPASTGAMPAGNLRNSSPDYNMDRAQQLRNPPAGQYTPDASNSYNGLPPARAGSPIVQTPDGAMFVKGDRARSLRGNNGNGVNGANGMNGFNGSSGDLRNGANGMSVASNDFSRGARIDNQTLNNYMASGMISRDGSAWHGSGRGRRAVSVHATFGTNDWLVSVVYSRGPIFAPFVNPVMSFCGLDYFWSLCGFDGCYRPFTYGNIGFYTLGGDYNYFARLWDQRYRERFGEAPPPQTYPQPPAPPVQPAQPPVAVPMQPQVAEKEKIVERVVIPKDYLVEYLKICDKLQVDNVATGYLNHAFWLEKHANPDKEYLIARDDQKKGRVMVWNKTDNVAGTIDYTKFLQDGVSAPELIAYLNGELRKLGVDPSKFQVSFAEEHVCRQ